MSGKSLDWEEVVAGVYREDRGKVLASLIRLLGDFDMAEEALHDAFAAALAQWPVRGLPESPWRWLVSAGRFRAIDRIRKRARFAGYEAELGRLAEAEESAMPERELLEDDMLRLVFTCCHPILPPDAQVALTLREVCGLTTEEIARAFLTGAPTIAQRIVRAKARIREAGLPYEVPEPAALADRLENVLRVIYLIFNEGYSASAGDALLRHDLTREAIRLGRLLVGLLPDPEGQGLLALMLFTDSRRAARATTEGDVILLADQDRSRWDRAEIAEAGELLERSFGAGEIGSYGLQAAIAAEHARAGRMEDTDWRRIVGFYDLLLIADPSPVVALNRAAAIAMRDGPEAGLRLMDELLAGPLAAYSPGFSARAELLRRADRHAAARADYRRALSLATQRPERRFIEKRLSEPDDYGATSRADINSTSDS